MKVAFASKDTIHVDQHFGWCTQFEIYEVDAQGFVFLHSVDASQEIEEETGKLEYKISCLDASDIVYTLQIGPKAATMVKSAGIYPMKASSESEKIEDVLRALQKMMRENPPLWMQRILLRCTQPSA